MYDIYVSVRKPNGDKVVEVIKDVCSIVSVGCIRVVTTLISMRAFIGAIELDYKCKP